MYNYLDDIAQEWEKSDGAFEMLHRMNVVRLEYIVQTLRKFFPALKGLKVLDLGCGGGILSVPLAKLGMNVTGVDNGEKAVFYAAKLAKKENVAVDFICESAVTFFDTARCFDVILMMESIEHIDEWKILLQKVRDSIAKLVIISSINRTVLSYIKTILLGEYVLNFVPRGTHNWCNYVKPSELVDIMYPSYRISDVHGMQYDFIKKSWLLHDKIDSNYVISFIR
ncbi:Ubiquinone biosynthesis O-methyltransferase [Candidatus Fokinia solitaria]|uniref:Ubiquinone biosynthesis O-methyltransferase n=1 Tax=Candidatus Fokinia solitaria TaxID=1802984 RepID=A0A2U8BT69_9RICK|nr:bifunctional 2-polyprenyl-6-hydroxyphenol methylase/3-demethylubiquinol 3-O-methyltransferase UbiG [Candidatus Fokinia solitaria]AWD33505.1 Ubiquinone biosynthesis O-methyltransferase [Candidatus Fokinia solitaria]